MAATRANSLNTIVNHVTFVALLDGDPPRLLFRKDLRRGDGHRIFTEAVPVLDAAMRRRITLDLKAEDEIELSVAYDYSSPGWPSCVVSYRRTIPAPMAAVPKQDLAAV